MAKVNYCYFPIGLLLLNSFSNEKSLFKSLLYVSLFLFVFSYVLCVYYLSKTNVLNKIKPASISIHISDKQVYLSFDNQAGATIWKHVLIDAYAQRNTYL